MYHMSKMKKKKHNCECDKKGHFEKEDNLCKVCVCEQLKGLKDQAEIDVFLSSGQVFENVIFIHLDQKNCCAMFKDPTKKQGSILLVDCQEIQAIRIDTF